MKDDKKPQTSGNYAFTEINLISFHMEAIYISGVPDSMYKETRTFQYEIEGSAIGLADELESFCRREQENYVVLLNLYGVTSLLGV